jgi:hypothetical protein
MLCVADAMLSIDRVVRGNSRCQESISNRVDLFTFLYGPSRCDASITKIWLFCVNFGR